MFIYKGGAPEILEFSRAPPVVGDRLLSSQESVKF